MRNARRSAIIFSCADAIDFRGESSFSKSISTARGRKTGQRCPDSACSGLSDWRKPLDCARLSAPMAERDFVILRYQGKVPAMASCVGCQRKFFTPTTLFS